jgi:hypothetical protein
MIEMTERQSRAVAQRLRELQPAQASELRTMFGLGRMDPMEVFPDIRDQMIDLPPPPPAAIAEAPESPTLQSWFDRRNEALGRPTPSPMDTWGLGRPDKPDPEPVVNFEYVDDEDVAQYAYNAGFRGEDLVTMIAVGISESGMDPTGGNNPIARANAIGDVGIMDDDWDESIGIFQVRSLKDPFDPRWSAPDRLRIREQLFDPQYNANAAYAIYRQKRNPENNVSGFQDWTEYVNGNYQQYLDRARAAAFNVVR